ncbi:hypothetical protein [Runella sp.]|uniref:hypothetical protein n=1 Tax=Runella sp. TaxID=1960881 RepID=UPI003D116281
MKNSTELLRFIARLASAIIKSLEDRKLTFRDLPNFLHLLPLIRPAFEDIPDAWDEFRRMSDQEREDLQYVMADETGLDMADPRAKALLDNAIDAALSLIKFVVSLRRVVV